MYQDRSWHACNVQRHLQLLAKVADHATAGQIYLLMHIQITANAVTEQVLLETGDAAAHQDGDEGNRVHGRLDGHEPKPAPGNGGVRQLRGRC